MSLGVCGWEFAWQHRGQHAEEEEQVCHDSHPPHCSLVGLCSRLGLNRLQSRLQPEFNRIVSKLLNEETRITNILVSFVDLFLWTRA